MNILVATTNPGKAREFREMLGSDSIQWSDLTGRSSDPVEESGHTFRANACLKASEYARRFKTWTLADDSGLSVDALDGKPGVHSARWAELHDKGNGDADNNRLLLDQLKHTPDADRTARFVCVLALADASGRIVLTSRGTVEGHILRVARGSNGFGYDPLFFIDAMNATTAELPPAAKHAISHRGQALARLRDLMRATGLG